MLCMQWLTWWCVVPHIGATSSEINEIHEKTTALLIIHSDLNNVVYYHASSYHYYSYDSTLSILLYCFTRSQTLRDENTWCTFSIGSIMSSRWNYINQRTYHSDINIYKTQIFHLLITLTLTKLCINDLSEYFMRIKYHFYYVSNNQFKSSLIFPAFLFNKSQLDHQLDGVISNLINLKLRTIRRSFN